MNPIRKKYAFTGTLQENRIEGGAAVIGSMDQGGDVILPGFFGKDVLDTFLHEGFIAVGHDWGDLPVATPEIAEERGAELYTIGEFHSTDRAQDARTVAKERLDRGKTMGLSIGFGIAEDGQKTFKSGTELLTHAKSILAGPQYALMDEPGLKDYVGECRALLPGGCAKLYEYSIVPAPMHTGATATQVKSADGQTEADASAETPVADEPKCNKAVAAAQAQLKALKDARQADKPAPATPAVGLVTKTATGAIQIKGQHLGEWVEASATASACSSITDALEWALYDAIWDCLYSYGDEAPTSEELDAALTELAACFDEQRDTCLAIVRAMLAVTQESAGAKSALTAELKDLRFELQRPADERSTLTFTKRLAALATETKGFAQAASRRQEIRLKDGRKHSAETITRMTEVREHLAAGLSALDEMLGECADAPQVEEPKSADYPGLATALLTLTNAQNALAGVPTVQ